MRALLVTTGSRGDVEPFVALAAGLADAGHEPVLAGPARYAHLATAHGVAFRALDDSLLDLQDELADRGTLGALTGASKASAAFERFLVDVVRLADLPTDIVVYHPKTLAAPTIAEHQGVPAMAAQLIPIYQPTGAFPSPLVSARVPGWLNRATWPLASAIELPWRRTLRRIRRERLGLTTPPVGMRAQIRAAGSLNAWSPYLLPAPAEWPQCAAPLGFWRRPTGEQQPPARVRDFLEAGEPPVYVGFGSMRSKDPAALGEAVVQGLRRARRRGVVAVGSGAVQLDAGDDILLVDDVPHDWLLPRVAAAVHHGGVGTVAAALAAGAPQVISPFLGDQWFWARRVNALGIGVPLRTVTADSLSEAVATAIRLAPRARVAAAAVAEERGVAAAIARLTGRIEHT